MMQCVTTRFLVVTIFCFFHVLFVKSERKYLLYDVNSMEGFNLRRDVYMRMANLLRVLREPDEYPHSYLGDLTFQSQSWVLVLPPWASMPHWVDRSENKSVKAQLNNVGGLPWSKFFDFESLKTFIPVIEFKNYQKEILASRGEVTIDAAFYIQQLTTPLGQHENPVIDTRKPNISNVEGTMYLKCNDRYTGITKDKNGMHYGFFTDSVASELQHRMKLGATYYECLSGALQAIHLAPFLSDFVIKNPDVQSIFLGAAEAVIHGTWSEWSSAYWTARRSMVFAKTLRAIGDKFRKNFLDSNDQNDRTEPPKSWLYSPWPLSPAKGGPYIAVHWRRGDFAKETNPTYSPSIENTAKQIKTAFKLANMDSSKIITTIFISSDCSDNEFEQLSSQLYPRSVVRFLPRLVGRNNLHPGEIAIIDQWICAHAQYFIGTNPSTFTFRITEERQIMGFKPDSTYNTLCFKGEPLLHSSVEIVENRDDCLQLTEWTVLYETRYTIPLRYNNQNVKRPNYHDASEF